MEAHEVLDMGALGVRIEITRADADALEYDVTGSPRGLLAQEHIHVLSRERVEVRHGALTVRTKGEVHRLSQGDTIEIAPGTSHQLLGVASAPHVVHMTMTPPGRTLDLLRYVAALCAAGAINRFDFPGPRAVATVVREFGAEGHSTHPPLPVQRALASLVLGADSARCAAYTTLRRAGERVARVRAR